MVFKLIQQLDFLLYHRMQIPKNFSNKTAYFYEFL